MIITKAPKVWYVYFYHSEQNFFVRPSIHVENIQYFTFVQIVIDLGRWLQNY